MFPLFKEGVVEACFNSFVNETVKKMGRQDFERVESSGGLSEEYRECFQTNGICKAR